MSRGGRTGVRNFVRPGIRAHAMKFNVDAQARRRLKIALETLDKHADAVVLALEIGGINTANYAVQRIRHALDLLVYGERGEFR